MSRAYWPLFAFIMLAILGQSIAWGLKQSPPHNREQPAVAPYQDSNTAGAIIDLGAQIKNEQKRKQESGWYDYLLEKPTDWLLVTFNAFLAVFTWRLWISTAHLFKVTKIAADAATLSARAAIGVELPIINLSRLTLLGMEHLGAAGTPIAPDTMPPILCRLTINFKNAGRSPAEAITQCVEWRVAEKLPQVPVYENFYPYAPGLFFPPDNKEPPFGLQNYFIQFSPTELAAISTRRGYLWVYGFVAIRDVIVGEQREFRYCAKWLAYREASAAPVGFVHDSETPPEYTRRS
jgi:hypothetical protein